MTSPICPSRMARMSSISGPGQKLPRASIVRAMARAAAPTAAPIAATCAVPAPCASGPADASRAACSRASSGFAATFTPPADGSRITTWINGVMGVDYHEPYVQQAAEWLRMVQNSDGGWGETCGSYDDANTKGVGPSTPSQTAWGLLALLATGDRAEMARASRPNPWTLDGLPNRSPKYGSMACSTSGCTGVEAL